MFLYSLIHLGVYLDILFVLSFVILFFFFNDTATTEIYTLSLHDALPICLHCADARDVDGLDTRERRHLGHVAVADDARGRSEEHTSELQSQSNLVCRLLLEKKKNKK